MKIPQISKTWHSIALIFVMIPIGSVAIASDAGTIHTFSDVGSTLLHSLLTSVKVACGWIFFRSPWAGQFQGLLHQESDTKETQPSGAVVERHAETTVSVPVDAPKSERPPT